MPQIKTYDQQVGRPQDVQQSNVSTSTAGLPSKALVDVGESITNLGERVHKYNTRKDIYNASLSEAELRTEFETTIRERASSNTLNTKDIEAEFAEKASELRAETNEGQDYLDLQMAQLQSQVIRSSAAAQAQMAGEIDAITRQKTDTLNANGLITNPANYDQVLASRFTAIDADVALGTTSFADGEKFKLKAGAEYATATAKGFISSGPQGREKARKDLTGGKYDAYLDADRKASLIDHINSLNKADAENADSVQKLRFSNPWKFFEKVGVAVPPVDLNNKDSIVAREQAIKDLSSKFQFPPGAVPFLSKNEAAGYTMLLQSQDPKETAAMLLDLSTTIPPRLYSTIARQVYEDKPAYGVAMGIGKEDENTTLKILDGHKLRNPDEKGKSMALPPYNKVLEDLDGYMGNAIRDQNVNLAFKDAIYSHYVSTQFSGGSDMSEVDTNGLKASAQKVFGPVGRLNNSSFPSFRDQSGEFVPATILQSAFQRLDSKTIMEVQGDVPRIRDGEPLNLKKAGADIEPISAGNGKYYIKRSWDNYFTKDKDGNPFVLDMKTYMEKYNPSDKNKMYKEIFRK